MNGPIVKKTVKCLKIATKLAIGLTTICVVISGFSYLGIKLSAKINNLLDFDEVKSYEAVEVAYPGYRNDNPIIVSISDSFNKHYKKEIIEGLKYVDEVVNGVKFIIVTGDIDNADIKIKLDSNIDALGVAEQHGEGTGVVYINNKQWHVTGIKATVAHEIGHILGLGHKKDISSIMYPIVAQWGFSKEDIDDLNDLWPANENELTQ